MIEAATSKIRRGRMPPAILTTSVAMEVCVDGGRFECTLYVNATIQDYDNDSGLQ